MSPLTVRCILAGSLVLLGCATVRPLNEYDFRGTGQDTHNRWMRLLVARYDCDTLLLRSIAQLPGSSQGQPATIDLGPDVRGNHIIMPNPNASGPSRWVPALGSTPCQLAYTYPTAIRVWKTDEGIREDWMHGVAVAYQLEGPNPPNLRLTLVLQR